MKRFLVVTLACFLCSVYGLSQSTNTENAPTANSQKRTVFRATKDQIKEAQTKLKASNGYTGEASGTMDDATRAALKNYQKENGLKVTGTLSRETLEKMGIALTEKQMATSSAESKPEPEMEARSSTENRSRGPIFRATKDQINAAQRLLKEKGMYSGDEIGKLDDATREGLKKFQSENGLKVTGTLNAVTLEKMGIPLTDKQKADIAASTTNK